MSSWTGKTSKVSPPHLAQEDRSSSASTQADESVDDDWVNVETRPAKDEPTRPLTVVFYVVALYFVFQILTRADDREILSHLPPTSSILSANILSSPHTDIAHTLYHPYNVPHLAPHLPRPPSPSSDSTWSYLIAGLRMLVYPFYLLGAIAAVPLPLICKVVSSAVSLSVSVTLVALHVIMYPATSTLDLIISTFVVGPIKVLGAGLSVFKPMLSFLGTVVVVGGLMGLTVGWIGKKFLIWLGGDGTRRTGKSPRSKSKSGRRSNRSSKRPSREPQVETSVDLELDLTPRTRSYHDIVDDIVSDDEDALAGFDEAWQGGYRASARQPPVQATRRRVRPFDDK